MKKKTKGVVIGKAKRRKASLKQLNPIYFRAEVNTSTTPSFEDKINPDHYKGKIETFDYLKDKLSSEELAGFCKGNIIKYVTREAKKGGVEDLKKSKWYLDKLISLK